MKISLPKGKHIIAVSGGVDSMVLMDVLAKKRDASSRLVVGHFNHGIRNDAAKDAELVRAAAQKHGLVFVTAKGRMGKRASEEEARKARYTFLRRLQKRYSARSIVTAHHRDDLVETAFINLLRGTGRHGLTSMYSSEIARPFLGYSKREIIRYAQAHKVSWREDSTNSDTTYLRNYIRKNITPRLSLAEINLLTHNLNKMVSVNAQCDEIIATLSQAITNRGAIKRANFSLLPANIADELMAYWLRKEQNGVFNKSMVYRLSNVLKTARPNTRHAVVDKLYLNISLKEAHFERCG